MNNDMWSLSLSNTKCDECDMCSLDVECNSAYGFSTKIELKCKKAAEKYLILYSPALEMMIAIVSMQIKSSLKLFLKIGKGHAALELFSMAIGIHAMDKKNFSKCLHKLYEEKCTTSKKTFLKFRKVVRKHHEDLLGTANGVIDITVSYDGTWQKRGHSSLYGDRNRYRHFDWAHY
ncbi:uncharacterized protein TNCV_1631091 [Trichonephila clavipes]|nr:uncharacterized protein TNCV_1631091 [Trichonephila clavipes]